MAISLPHLESITGSKAGEPFTDADEPGPTPGKECLLLAIIPAFNEEQTIGSVVLKTRRIASRVLVIDDGSIDDTALIAASAGAKVISHPFNMGKGAALRTGFAAGMEYSPGAVVVLDSDGQHDPSDISVLVEPVLQGRADMVIGSRYLKEGIDHPGTHGISRQLKEHEDPEKQGKSREPENHENHEKPGESGTPDSSGSTGESVSSMRTPFHRRIGQKVLDRFTGVAADKRMKLTDTQSGFRAFSGDAIRRFSLVEDGFAIESEMITEAMELGLRITEVPVKCLYPEKGKSHTYKAGKHGTDVLSSLLRFIKEKRPFIFFGGPGLFLLMLGLVMGIKTVNIYDEGGVLPVGYAMLSMLLTIIGSLGIVGAVILNSIQQTVWKIRLAFD